MSFHTFFLSTGLLTKKIMCHFLREVLWSFVFTWSYLHFIQMIFTSSRGQLILLHFFLAHLRLSGIFRFLGCIILVANSVLIKICSHQFLVHINEHLHVVWLICCMVSFLDLVYGGSILGRYSSTLMRFQTMSIRLKSWIHALSKFSLVFDS